MNADERRSEQDLNFLTERILGCALEVSNVLGAGFLEQVYHRALLAELRLKGLKAKAEVSFRVEYKGQYIGEYRADIVVEDRVIVELKCVDHLSNDHAAQCLNYLKASGHTIALLVNFQKPRVEWKRMVRGL